MNCGARPPESMRQTRIAAFAAVGEERRGLDFGNPTDYDRLWRWSVEHLDQFWADVADLVRRAARRPRRRGADRPRDARGRLVPRPTINFAEQALPARDRRGPRAGCRRRGRASRWRSPGRRCAARWARSPRPCAGSACGPATGWPATCPTCPRRSSPSSARRRSARSGPPARPTSAPAPSSTGSPRSSPPCWSPSTATASTARTTTAGTSSPSCGRALPTVRTTIAVPRLFPDEVPGRRAGLGRGRRRRAGARVRRAALRPPAVDRLLVGHDRAAEGHRARPRRRGARAAQAGGAAHGHRRRATGSSGTPRPPGSCGTSRPRRCWPARTVVVYDGAPTYPVRRRAVRPRRPDRHHLPRHQPRLPDGACEKAGVPPGRDARPVRAARPSASPARRCRPSTFRWVYDAVKPDVLLGSLSGGTDVATGFIGSSPLLPVTAGELQRPMLGVAAASWNEDGRAGRRRARRAGDHRADAVDAAVLLERPGRRPLPRGLLRAVARASGGTATGWRSPSAAPASSPAARTPRSTAAASAWGRRTSTRPSSRSPPSSTASSSAWSSPTAATGCRCSCSSRRARS